MNEGITLGLRSVGLALEALHQVAVPDDDSARIEALQVLFNSRPKRTAIITDDDSLAALVIAYARKSGSVRIPEDLSVASLCELPYFTHLEPRLTTVQYRFFEAGRDIALNLYEAWGTGRPAVGRAYLPVYCQGETVFHAQHSQRTR